METGQKDVRSVYQKSNSTTAIRKADLAMKSNDLNTLRYSTISSSTPSLKQPIETQVKDQTQLKATVTLSGFSCTKQLPTKILEPKT